MKINDRDNVEINLKTGINMPRRILKGRKCNQIRLCYRTCPAGYEKGEHVHTIT